MLMCYVNTTFEHKDLCALWRGGKIQNTLKVFVGEVKIVEIVV